MNALKKVIAEQDKESRKQVAIVYGCTAIALHRLYGWDMDRINHLLTTTEDYWDRVGHNGNVSMLQMLEDATGINMQMAEDGHNWHEVPFLNGTWRISKMTKGQEVMVRRARIKWTGTLLMACMLLGLYEVENMDTDQLAEVMNEVCAIREEYAYNDVEIAKQAYYEVGVKIVGLIITEEDNTI